MMTAREYCTRFPIPISYKILDNGHYLRFYGSGVKENESTCYAFLRDLNPDYTEAGYHTCRIDISKRGCREYITYNNHRLYLDTFIPVVGEVGDFIEDTIL